MHDLYVLATPSTFHCSLTLEVSAGGGVPLTVMLIFCFAGIPANRYSGDCDRW